GFVDQPLHAVIDGHDLLASAMKERGYPVEDADQIAADLSVTHTATLGHYRAAQEISAAAGRGDASTEDLRQALIHVRVVFGELLGKPGDAEPTESVEAGPGPRVLGAGTPVPGSGVLEAGEPEAPGRAPGTAAPGSPATGTAVPAG